MRNWKTSTQNVRSNAEACKIFKIDKQIFYLQGKFRKIMKLPRRVQDILLLSKVALKGMKFTSENRPTFRFSVVAFEPQVHRKKLFGRELRLSISAIVR